METVDCGIALISDLGRNGFNVVCVPARNIDDEPDYASAIIDRAQKRGMRVLVDIGATTVERGGHLALTDETAIRVVQHWLDAGASGIELGADRVTDESAYRHSGLDLRLFQDYLAQYYPDAMLSLGFIADEEKEMISRIRTDLTHVVRTYRIDYAITAENIQRRMLNRFRSFEKCGVIPSWDLSGAALNALSGDIRSNGMLQAMLAFPGVLHLDRRAMMMTPSVRHGLRLRHTHRLASKSLAIDNGLADRGIISLFIDPFEVRLNFGPEIDAVANDGRVVSSSRIELPSQGNDLLIPPGDVAWIIRR